MLIDFDSSTKLAQKGDASVDVDEVAHRTVNDTLHIPSRHLTRLQGTPKYIARSVSLGKVLIDSDTLLADPMPELSEEAKNLYIKAYGKDRYDTYAEKVPPLSPAVALLASELVKEFPDLLASRDTIHGGRPPSLSRMKDMKAKKVPIVPFAHRPEHDVESVWWTMMSTLVRVQPANRPQEEFVPTSLSLLWQAFSEHAIMADPSPLHDRRSTILARRIEEWLSDFAPFPELQDVGRLLFAIACQVRCEYALWDPQPPHPDHLHEAVQRLILQYLVDHKDKDVKLTGDPSRLRPVDKEVPPPDSKAVKANGTTPKTRNYTPIMEAFPAPTVASDYRPMKRKSHSRNSGPPDAPKTKRRKGDDDDDAAAA